MLTRNKNADGRGVGHKTSTRVRNSTKPTFSTAAPAFYRCSRCRRLLVQQFAGQGTLSIICCGEPMVELKPHEPTDAAAEQHLPAMVVSGGFESNALSVTVGAPPHPMDGEHHLEWIYLYTFQGGQIKFIAPGDKPSAIFSLAESDAYVYCDRAVCKGNQCKFNCKRGFTAYAYCNRHGLWKNTF
ncbi:desulfoferrodoxin family protein [Brenneria goodwinii]|uniref:Superoxide reductase n=1 Tax=Brenneria goodwinii TaxID=1109412 RepID=A0A0G4JWK5_9GAMM|nr:desulfoferrodoxin family protein [Brenneria goodwinii]CPR17209.1 Superoxide reductase [Brenneria goodwinii]